MNEGLRRVKLSPFKMSKATFERHPQANKYFATSAVQLDTDIGEYNKEGRIDCSDVLQR